MFAMSQAGLKSPSAFGTCKPTTCLTRDVPRRSSVVVCSQSREEPLYALIKRATAGAAAAVFLLVSCAAAWECLLPSWVDLNARRFVKRSCRNMRALWGPFAASIDDSTLRQTNLDVTFDDDLQALRMSSFPSPVGRRNEYNNGMHRDRLHPYMPLLLWRPSPLMHDTVTAEERSLSSKS